MGCIDYFVNGNFLCVKCGVCGCEIDVVDYCEYQSDGFDYVKYCYDCLDVICCEMNVGQGYDVGFGEVDYVNRKIGVGMVFDECWKIVCYVCCGSFVDE